MKQETSGLVEQWSLGGLSPAVKGDPKGRWTQSRDFQLGQAPRIRVERRQERVHHFPCLVLVPEFFCASSVLSNNGCIETRVSPDSRYLLGETRSIFMWLLAATPFSYTSFVLLHGPAFQWEILIE